MLARSHRKLEQRLAELGGAAAAYRSTGEAAALDAAHQVCRFLEKSALRHEEDEEHSVFPRLSGPGVSELVALLTAEHREHTAMIDELAAALAAPAVDARRLVEIASSLEHAYAGHMAREETQIMPRILDLDASVLDEIYGEMQARRGR